MTQQGMYFRNMKKKYFLKICRSGILYWPQQYNTTVILLQTKDLVWWGASDYNKTVYYITLECWGIKENEASYPQSSVLNQHHHTVNIIKHVTLSVLNQHHHTVNIIKHVTLSVLNQHRKHNKTCYTYNHVNIRI